MEIDELLKQARRLAKKIKKEGIIKTDLRIAVLGTNSIQHFVMVLRLLLNSEGISANIYEGEYNGIMMDIMDSESQFNNAKDEISANPAVVPIWQAIISKYRPTFIGDCQKAIVWTETIVKEWLKTNMLMNENDPEVLAERVVEVIGSHKETYSHEKHLHIDTCRSLNIKVIELEKMEKSEIDGCKDLQDCVLTIHHTYMQTFSVTNAVKSKRLI